MTGFETRAHERRRTWSGGRVAGHEELAAVDLCFWQEATASERLTAVWLMAFESLVMKGDHEPASGFQGSAVGVRSRASEIAAKQASAREQDLLDIKQLLGTRGEEGTS